METTDRVYQFIVEFWHTNGVSPTLREIASALGIGQTTANYHVKRLEEQGELDRYMGQKSRSIRVKGWNWSVDR